jgi:hypothetical protein
MMLRLTFSFVNLDFLGISGVGKDIENGGTFGIGRRFTHYLEQLSFVTFPIVIYSVPREDKM